MAEFDKDKIQMGTRGDMESARAQSIQRLLASQDPEERAGARLMQVLYPALQGWLDGEESQGTDLGDVAGALLKVATAEIANVVLMLAKPERKGRALRGFAEHMGIGFEAIAKTVESIPEDPCDCPACAAERDIEAAQFLNPRNPKVH